MLQEIYIEDLILCLAGVAPIDDSIDLPTIKSSDYSLIKSFSTQIIRNLGFTDRQFELAKRKVFDYEDYFSFVNNLDVVASRHRIPLRTIDRSRWVKIIENDKGDYLIAIRFTFQKKLISAIAQLRKALSDKGVYNKETKTHMFEYSEHNLYEIVNALKDNNFELDDLVQEIYNKIKDFKLEDYVPGVYNFEIKNLHPKGKEAILKELGPPSNENILLYKDRSSKYSLYIDHTTAQDNSLASRIANRKSLNVRINSDTIKLDSVLLALQDLDRFPLLVLLAKETCYDQLISMQEYVRNLIPSEQISVMFRLDNQGEGIHFNNYVRDQKINNKLDSNTKIVYTLDSKISKPLLNSDWDPKCILLQETRSHNVRRIFEYFSNKDLILHYQDNKIPMDYFYRTFIEEIG